MNQPVKLNGVEVWVYLVEQDSGFQIRLSLDDWDRCRLHRGQRISLRRPSRREEWFFLAELMEVPPFATFALTNRVRIAS